MVIADTQTVPLKTDQTGMIRVGNTRVRLATVIHTFNEGFTAEEIVSQYPALALADVAADNSLEKLLTPVAIDCDPLGTIHHGLNDPMPRRSREAGASALALK